MWSEILLSIGGGIFFVGASGYSVYQLGRFSQRKQLELNIKELEKRKNESEEFRKILKEQKAVLDNYDKIIDGNKKLDLVFKSPKEENNFLN